MMHDDMKGAVDSLAEPADPSTFVASNGLRLKLKRVSQMIMTDAARRLSAPRPPRTFIESKGREEENPSDPEYVTAVRNYRYDVGLLAVHTYFILGTQIEHVPEGIQPVESEDWVEMLKAIDPDVDIPATGPRRYLAWLKYHALPDPDQNALLKQCIRYSGGTLEVDVEVAQASFRDQPARDTANGIYTANQSGLGDLPGTNAGDGAGVRG